MTFDEALDQVRVLLQQRGRVTYRSLKLRYQLDDELLAGVADELISAERVAVDEDGKVLVWIGTARVSGSTFQVPGSKADHQQRATSNVPPLSQNSGLSTQHLSSPAPRTQHPDASREAERRQMTVTFIDMVGSTALSEQLDPEELRTVIRKYRATCATIIGRCAGYVAKYIGDGLLVYFGYPTAHEDDAQRAVRAGLSIVAALPQLNAELQSILGGHGCAPYKYALVSTRGWWWRRRWAQKTNLSPWP